MHLLRLLGIPTKRGSRYGFINEPLRNRSETRVALIPTAPLLKIPKLPSASPLAGQARVEPPPPGPGGGSEGPTARTPGPRTEAEHDSYKRRETERVGKWMAMMGVKRREGGNAVEWSWKDEGKSKVRHPQDAGDEKVGPRGKLICAAYTPGVQGHT